ncbi:MAG: hypothetical protein ABI670_14915 [Chloroflexota bacterium]
MSNTSWDPAAPLAARDRKRPLFALVVLAVGIIGIVLLGFLYLRETGTAVVIPAASTPTTLAIVESTPTSALVIRATPTAFSQANPTPGHPGGLNGPEVDTATPTPQPEVLATATRLPTPAPTSTPASPAERALLALQASDVPVRDLYSIAARLKFKTGEAIPHTTDRPAGDYKVGHVDTFFISDLPNKRYYTTTATIREVTDHAYWYVQDGRPVDTPALRSAARTFDSTIYPTNHELFGTEWTPGVDNDPRITMLFASIPGAGGYFSSADEYTRMINPFSNEREIIYINVDGGFNGVESTLAHELQHMIHWHEHANHDVWLNEGASVLASAMNGYQIAGVDSDFMREPDTQLNSWQASADAARANYGASFLFLDFLRTHYGGDDMIRTMVSSPGQGTEVIDNALKSMGRPERFADVFAKWVLANLLDVVPGADADGLAYPDRDVSVSTQDSLRNYPVERHETVSQFGSDYIELLPPDSGSTLQINFAGQKEVPVIKAPAHSGEGIWWSNRGDLVDSSMTRTFDLSKVGAATLDYYIWFDTEADLDYGYVEVSTDGGTTWDTLQGSGTGATNPNGTNFGNGYSGSSADKPGADEQGWLHEQIDISAYAGKQALVRFEYITDDGYNAGGLAVDDITIPEIGYSDSAETDAPDGWQMSGFVRLANKLPQSYYVAVVKLSKTGFDVQPVDILPDGTASVTVDGLGTEWDRAVLIVSGTTTHNIHTTSYTLRVTAVK